MLYQTEGAIEKILRDEKTNSRRRVKLNHIAIFDADGNIKAICVKARDGKLRPVYEVGKTYAVQPGRGKRGVGRIRILSIWREDVREISHEDALAEGYTSIGEFLQVWCGMHDTAVTIHHLAQHGFWMMYVKDATAARVGTELDVADWLYSRAAECYDAWAIQFERVKEA